MKLRNKKTGEIVECPMIRVSIDVGDLMHYEFPNSLAELNEDWEDYEPKEPLIEYVIARKMFRAWANYVGLSTYKYDAEHDCLVGNPDGLLSNRLYFSFSCRAATENLTDGAIYTIDELCGEEEE